MIATALFALQLTAAARVAPLVVRDVANHSVQVPLVATADGPMFRPESLPSALSVSVQKEVANRFAVVVSGVRFDIEPGLAAVRVNGEVYQLGAAPTVRDRHLLVPLQLISDVVPLHVPNTRWDAEARQLVLFANLAGTSRPGPAAEPPRRTASRPAPAAAPVPREGKRGRRTIIVDAGHGGPDNGMTGPLGGGGAKLYEKNVTLAVSKRLGQVLANRGVDVVYTRTRDTLIALDDRGRIANQASGDLFISIHVNAASPTWRDPGGARGFETYFLSEARTEDARRVERMENEAVRFEGTTAPVGRDDPLGFILNDLAQNEHLRESSELAEVVQRHLGRMHPGPNRGVKQAGFRVLVTAYMPAVLVEIGFGTNRREAAYLLSRDAQDAIATAIADAAMEYLQSYERRVAGPAQ